MSESLSLTLITKIKDVFLHMWTHGGCIMTDTQSDICNIALNIKIFKHRFLAQPHVYILFSRATTNKWFLERCASFSCPALEGLEHWLPK